MAPKRESTLGQHHFQVRRNSQKTFQGLFRLAALGLHVVHQPAEHQIEFGQLWPKTAAFHQAQHGNCLVGLDLAKPLHHAPHPPRPHLGADEKGKTDMTAGINAEITGHDAFAAQHLAWAGELAGLDDVAIIGLDPKRTALGMWEPRFTFVAKTIADCTRALVWLWAENERRLDVMEAAGVDEWTTDLDGSPFIVVMIDELVQVSSVDGSELVQFMIDPTDLTNTTSSADRSKHLAAAMRTASTGQKAQGIFLSYLARLCRSSGIQIVAATQYPMSEVVDPQVRANLGLRVMLRVPSNEMVKVCLGDGQHDDITADSISYEERGGCWIAGLGGRPVRARGFDVTTTDGRNRAHTTAHLRWSMTDVFVGQDLNLDRPGLNRRGGVVGVEAEPGPQPQAEGRVEPTAINNPPNVPVPESVSLLGFGS